MTKYQQINLELERLFESSDNSAGVIFNITSHSPLEPVQPNHMFQHCINPLTGDYYDGIYLAGEFASIGVLNNNNRLYVKSNYLELLEYLREQIHTIGVYGELEHPEKYPVNYNNASHKLVDIWYDESTDKVMGVIVLLDTDAGRKAAEIVKSGGKIALSARGGGDEIVNNDGSITAMLRLLVTFDLVSTPGFTTARQEYVGTGSAIDSVKLNMYFPNGSKLKNNKVKVVNAEEYQVLNESVLEPMKQQQKQQASQSKQQQDTETLQDGDDKAQQKVENQLSKQVDETLNQSVVHMQSLVRKDKHNGLFTENTAAGGMNDIANTTVNESEEEFQKLMESFNFTK